MDRSNPVVCFRRLFLLLNDNSLKCSLTWATQDVEAAGSCSPLSAGRSHARRVLTSPQPSIPLHGCCSPPGCRC